MGDEELDAGTILSISDYIDKNENLSPSKLYSQLIESYKVNPKDILAIIREKKGESYVSKINIKPNKLERTVSQAPIEETVQTKHERRKRRISLGIITTLIVAALAFGGYFINKNYQEKKKQEQIRVEQTLEAARMKEIQEKEDYELKILEQKRETVDVFLGRLVCDSCDGTQKRVCSICKGSKQYLEYGRDYGVLERKITCPYCNGKGQGPYGTCPNCKGRGEVLQKYSHYTRKYSPCFHCRDSSNNPTGIEKCSFCKDGYSFNLVATIVRNTHGQTLDTIKGRELPLSISRSEHDFSRKLGNFQDWQYILSNGKINPLDGN